MQVETWNVEGCAYAVRRVGEGAPLLLLHGIGPGTTALANFGGVIDRLAMHHQVVAIDLIGFGGSPPKREEPLFDVALWTRQALDAISRTLAASTAYDKICLWGQSLGGALALGAAAADARVRRVVTTGAGGGAKTVNAALQAFWMPPSDLAAFRKVIQSSMYDPSSLTEELVMQRFELMRSGAAEAFAAMMKPGVPAALAQAWLAPDTLRRVTCPVLMFHGRDDIQVPYRESALHLFDHLPDARLELLSRCGHNPAREHRELVLSQALNHFREA